MGWHRSIGRPVAAIALASIGLAAFHAPARAQAAADYTSLVGPYLTLYVGNTAAVGGSVAINVNGAAVRPLLVAGPVRPANNAPDLGSRIYIRVDGGSQSTQGLDYIFGDLQTAADGTLGGNGEWVQVPTVIGNQLVARWRTLPTDKASTGNGGGNNGGGGGGGATTVAIDHQIEVEMIASFVHDTVRFQFNIINRNTGVPHSVGLGFIQNIDVNPNSAGGDGPLRLPNYPYLRKDTVLSGGLVPRYWETFFQVSPGNGVNTTEVSHSIRGTLRPQSGLVNEPTPPTRFEFGDIQQLNGYNYPPAQRDFEKIWNFQPSTTFNATSTTAGDAGVGLIWTEQSVAAGQTLPITTFLGQSTTDNDFSAPLALSVSAPKALGYTVDRTNNSANATPNPFTITAYVTNLTNVLSAGGLTIAPVNLALDLPSGLRLDTGETLTKQINSIAPGNEGSAEWKVVPTGDKTGTLSYTVTASSNLGIGKSVQRSIDVPAPNKIQLKGNTVSRGLYQMLSFPLSFGNTAPSTILGLNAAPNPPDFDIARWNPVTSRYESVNTFTPGQAYWFRLLQPNDITKTIAPTTGSPLENQVQPGAAAYTINYPRGWNQISNPFLYGIRLSEVQVLDTEGLKLLYLDEAANSLNRWVLPAVYRYNTSDPDPANWSYELLDNLGFIMQPFEGYWLLVQKSALRFIYPGADTPGVTVTRSALVGVGLGATLGRNASNNWRLRVAAKSTSGSDSANYIGVAPKATDGDDVYKYAKPPLLDNQLTLDIVNKNAATTRLAQDLRAPGSNTKTWDLIVRSPKPNEEVTITWPEIAASVPRDHQLTLVDTENNVRRVMRNTSSYTLNTGAGATRAFQIVAEPLRRAGRIQITSFDVAPGRTRGAGGETSVAINYGFSQNADARINIRNGRGQTIRTLVPTTRAAEGGANAGGNVVWDLRDQQGTVLPGGVYQMELLAIGQDGQTSRQVRPYILSR